MAQQIMHGSTHMFLNTASKSKLSFNDGRLIYSNKFLEQSFFFYPHEKIIKLLTQK